MKTTQRLNKTGTSPFRHYHVITQHLKGFHMNGYAAAFIS